jgi:hypothetical protein
MHKHGGGCGGFDLWLRRAQQYLAGVKHLLLFVLVGFLHQVRAGGPVPPVTLLAWQQCRTCCDRRSAAKHANASRPITCGVCKRHCAAIHSKCGCVISMEGKAYSGPL